VPREKRLKELIYWMCFIGLLMVFGRSYYYIYLYHFALWRSLNIPMGRLVKWQQFVFAASLVAMFALVFCFSTYQVAENPAFATTYKASFKYIRVQQTKNTGKLIWVSPIMAMSSIDYDKARMYSLHYVVLRGAVPLLDRSSLYYAEQYKEVEYIAKFIVRNDDSLVVRNIIPPVKGLMKLGIKKERSDSLGLWELSVIPKNGITHFQ